MTEQTSRSVPLAPNGSPGAGTLKKNSHGRFCLNYLGADPRARWLKTLHDAAFAMVVRRVFADAVALIPFLVRPRPVERMANHGPVASPYDAPPASALAAISTHEGTLLVDLDETLYLRNSTEDFIDCARPGLLTLPLLKVLDALEPWRLTGGIATRDNWRVCAIQIVLPWTRWRWRAKVPFLAEHYVNRELKAVVEARAEPPVILTTGFNPIVGPLLAAMGFADAPLIAARTYSFADLRNGKLRMATRKLGVETVSRSLFVTDSINDLKVLETCARPLRTLWPQARYVPALSDIYLPGEYISRIKHPGQRYILRGIVQEDFAFWLLSSIGLAIAPVTHVAGLLLLLLSFWAVYERGYVENDLVAARYEPDPNLSAAFGSVQVATPVVQPWIWALILGAAAVAILHPDKMGFVVHFARWVAVLILTYVCFVYFNRLDKVTRVWLYPLLQFARGAAFVVVVPIVPAGIAALGAHVLSRWMPYQAYRLTPPSAGGWPGARRPTCCCSRFPGHPRRSATSRWPQPPGCRK